MTETLSTLKQQQDQWLTDARANLKSATTAVEKARTALTQARAERDQWQEQVENLERACGLRGRRTKKAEGNEQAGEEAATDGETPKPE